MPFPSIRTRRKEASASGLGSKLGALAMSALLVPFVRAAFVASVLSTFGVALFLSRLMPPVARRLEPSAACLVERQCRTVAWGSLLASSVAGLLWLVLETGAIVDA